MSGIGRKNEIGHGRVFPGKGLTHDRNGGLIHGQKGKITPPCPPLTRLLDPAEGF